MSRAAKVAAVACSAVGVAGVALAVGLVSAQESGAVQDPAPAELKSAYSVLTAGPHRMDATSEALARVSQGPPEYVRWIQALDGASVYVSAGAKQLCMAVAGPEGTSFNCTDATAAASAKYMIVTSAVSDGPMPATRVTALLPDNASSIAVEQGGRDIRSLQATTNVVSTIVNGPPSALTWQDGARAERVNLRSPAT